MAMCGETSAVLTPDTFLLSRLCALMKTGIFFLQGDSLTSYQEQDVSNPIRASEALRRRLIDGASRSALPYMELDEFHVCFAAIALGDSALLLGPMRTMDFTLARRHQFCQFYGVKVEDEKDLPLFTVYDAAVAVSTAAKAVCGREFPENELLKSNHLLGDLQENSREQFLHMLEDDEEEYERHTYQEEKMLLDQVREGNEEEAVRMSRVLDHEIGRLAENSADHWKNVMVIGITLCARAAVEGGLEPRAAYRVSGYYIRRGSSCGNAAQIQNNRDQAVADLARRVRKVRACRHAGSYTRQCKDYIDQHYRGKIRQEEVAAAMGISADYLSRLFREEIGLTFSEYVNQCRVECAANLLIYSESSLADIACYVNFPSQSYFGRIFKKAKGLTPKQYREMYKPSEFVSQ